MAWVQFAIQIPGQDFIDHHASIKYTLAQYMALNLAHNVVTK